MSSINKHSIKSALGQFYSTKGTRNIDELAKTLSRAQLGLLPADSRNTKIELKSTLTKHKNSDSKKKKLVSPSSKRKISMLSRVTLDSEMVKSKNSERKCRSKSKLRTSKHHKSSRQLINFKPMKDKPHHPHLGSSTTRK